MELLKWFIILEVIQNFSRSQDLILKAFYDYIRPMLVSNIAVTIIIIISCHRFSFFPGTSALEPVVNPKTQASSLSL
jgi:hypothetical protein